MEGSWGFGPSGKPEERRWRRNGGWRWEADRGERPSHFFVRACRVFFCEAKPNFSS